MLLKIDESVFEYLKKNYSKLHLIYEEVQALNNLSVAHRDRKHILIGTLNVVEFLKDFIPLDESAKRIYSNLYSKYSYMGAYEEIFDSHILIKSKEFPFSKNLIDGKIVFEVPITDFYDIESVHKTALIGEDRSDCEFYEGLAKKYFSANHKNANINLNFFHENGGGINTYKSLRYYSENKRISITIADSDKRYPESNVGNTLRKLRTEYNKHENQAITELIELPVREKENLIPPSMYLYCCNNSDRGRLEKLALLEQVEKHSEKLFYLDYKEGLTVKSYKKDPELQKYINDLLRDMPHLGTCNLDNVETLSEDHILIEGISMNISDYFSNGFFKEGLEKNLEAKLKVINIPEAVIEELRTNIEVKDKMFNHLPINFKVHIEEICKKLIDWGCSNNTFIST